MATEAIETVKTHWTRTPEGRERMRQIGRNRWKRRRRKSKKARTHVAKAHWSQTRRGKQIIKESNRRRRLRRAQKPTTPTQRHVHDNSPEIDAATFSYALGHVECWIQTFARSASVPEEALAARLGEVLSGKVRR